LIAFGQIPEGSPYPGALFENPWSVFPKDGKARPGTHRLYYKARSRPRMKPLFLPDKGIYFQYPALSFIMDFSCTNTAVA
jgi:hypothetical protein